MTEQPTQTIEKLNSRYTELNTKKIQAETQCENAKSSLDGLKKEALAKYGTDDVAALETALEKITAENAEKRVTYQAHLDAIESKLKAVEAEFAQGGTF